MAGIRIAAFGGVVPRTAPRLLGDTQAQIAKNCMLWNGDLRAWKDQLLIVTPSKVGTKLSIYRFGQDISNEAQYWFHWTADVNVVRGPVAGDTTEKTYYTGDGVPKVTDNSIALVGGTDYPMNWYTLGIPAPTPAPTAAVGGAGSGLAVSRIYVYTYVSAWGEEGPPSVASNSVSVQPGQTVTLSALATGPGAGYNIATKRLYRSNVGTNGTQFQFLAEIPVANTSYVDSTLDANLGEVIPSTTWVAPPTDLYSLVELGNGVLGGLSGNEFCMCEPNVPYAWPVTYRKAMAFGGVGLGAFDQTAVGITKGYPYIGSGNHPTSFTWDPIKYAPAGVSKRSIASIKGVGVIYAAASGLWMVGPGGAKNVIDQFMSPREWEPLVPSSMLGCDYKSRYFGFYNTGTVQAGFIFDPNDPNAPLTFTDVYATAAYNDPQRDALYLQIGADIKKWDAGAGQLTYDWKSKVFVPTAPVNMAVAQVECETYPVTFKMYADGVLKKTQTVTSSAPFRLPDGYKAREFEFEVTGTNHVKQVRAARSLTELRS